MSEHTAEVASPGPLEVPRNLSISDEAKLREAKLQSAKFRQEQLQLQRNADLRRSLERRKLQAELEAESARQEAERLHSLESRAKRLAGLQEKAKQRKERIATKVTQDEALTRKAGAYRYAASSLEEDFIRRVVQPDVEMERKLAVQKRILQKCPTSSDLKTHAMKFDEAIAEANERTRERLKQERIDFRLQEVNSFPQSQFTRSLLDREREEKLSQEYENRRRKLMKQRQDRYALLVREMFAPKPGAPEQMGESPRPPAKIKYSPPESAKPKVKPKAKVAKPVAKVSEKQKKPINYLAEMRKLRESTETLMTNLEVDWREEMNEEMDQTEKMKRVRDKAERLERRLRRAEASLSQSSPISLSALEAAQRVNDTLISSIHAKLSLIQS